MCCVMLFFKKIQSLSKARETGVRLQEGFCIRPWANKRNREILKMSHPQRQIQIFLLRKEPSLGEIGKGFCQPVNNTLANNGRDCFWSEETAGAEPQSLLRGAGSQRLPYPSPDASCPLTQHFIHMGIPSILQIFQRKRVYQFSHPNPSFQQRRIS